MKRSLLTLSSFLLFVYAGQSQIVGNDGYIPGKYVNIGISGLGGFEGADTITYPATGIVPGLHPRSNTNYLGFVANPLKDGWMTYDGDYFSPGSPENGWGIEIIDNAGSVDINASNNRVGDLDIPGAISSYAFTGGVHTLVWEGDFVQGVYDLHFTIEYTLQDTALYYNTNVTVSNNGDPIDVLYYYRNIDPDNNVTLTSDYTTTNTIVAQASGASAYCEVSATQTAPWFSSYTLSASDTTARVAYGGFSNRDGSDIWDGTGYMTGTPFATNIADEAIAIGCKIDSLFAFRQSHSFTFSSSFGTGFVTDVAHINADNLGLYPNPTNGLLSIRSKEAVQKVRVYNALGKLQMQVSNTGTVDLSALEAGIYLVDIETTAGKVTRRIVKQ